MNLFMKLFDSKSRIVLVTVMAVKRLIKIPSIRVKAKPRTGPEPVTKYKIKQVMIEEMFESRIEFHDLLKPSRIERCRSLPDFSSSFILSKMRTLASIAIPIERTKPAIPARVRVTGIIL